METHLDPSHHTTRFTRHATNADTHRGHGNDGNNRPFAPNRATYTDDPEVPTVIRRNAPTSA